MSFRSLPSFNLQSPPDGFKHQVGSSSKVLVVHDACAVGLELACSEQRMRWIRVTTTGISHLQDRGVSATKLKSGTVLSCQDLMVRVAFAVGLELACSEQRMRWIRVTTTGISHLQVSYISNRVDCSLLRSTSAASACRGRCLLIVKHLTPPALRAGGVRYY